MTTARASIRLRKSRPQILRMIHAGVLRGVKTPKGWRVEDTSVAALERSAAKPQRAPVSPKERMLDRLRALERDIRRYVP